MHPFNYDANILCVPLQGTFDLNENGQTLTIDLDDYVFVPFTIQNEQGEQIPDVTVMINNDAESLSWMGLDQNSQLILPKGECDLTFATGGYALLEKYLKVDGNMDKQIWVMSVVECWPLLIFPYSEFGDPAMATVTVENLGSYDVDGDYVYGDFKPFLAVPSGTYDVTITAQGYKTVQKTVVFSADTYSEEDGAVVYEFEMIPEGTGIEETQHNETKPSVNVSGGNLTVEIPIAARVTVYNMQGVAVWQGRGRCMTTSSLPTGVYVVHIQTAEGMKNIKVSVSR